MRKEDHRPKTKSADTSSKATVTEETDASTNTLTTPLPAVEEAEQDHQNTAEGQATDPDPQTEST